MTRLIAGLLQRQLHLTAFLRHLCSPGGNGVQGRFYAQGLEQPQDLRTHRLIDAQAAKGDASISTVVQVSTLAVIATCFPGRPAVSDVKLTSAVAAAQEAREQRLAASNGASRHQALAVGIIGNQALVPLELRP